MLGTSRDRAAKLTLKMATSACLKRFQLTKVEETEKELGRGSYAVVVEIQYQGLRCAAKKIHTIFCQQRAGDMATRFEAECSLLSQLRHPNIVQFLGIYFERGSNTPVLVMEYLPTTLASCLDRYGVLPEEISYSVLRDAALGLVYLHGHSPPIIHRDLSANNVLLTEGMTAKISDLGVAKMLNLTPAHMTQAPGTQAYMPPEALVARPIYSEKLDIFSFGIMILHTLCGRWPVPTKEAVDCHTLRGVSEVERRKTYLDGIGHGHALMSSIHLCLSNNPEIRPEALEILHQVSTAMECFPPSFENKVEMLRKIHKDSDRKKQLRDKADGLTSQKQQEVVTIQTQLEALKLSLNAEVDELRLEGSTLRTENTGLKTALATTKDVMIAKEEEVRLRLDEKDELLRINMKAKDEVLGARLKQNGDEMQARLKAKDEVLKTELERKDKEFASKLNAKEQEMAIKLLVRDQELAVKQKELDTKDALIATHQSSSEAKDATIQNILESLQQMQRFLGKCASPTLLQPSAKLEWEECADLPEQLTVPKAVVVGSQVYVAGSTTTNPNSPVREAPTYGIFVFDLLHKYWSIVPALPVEAGGLAKFTSKLVVVGGASKEGNAVRDVYGYDHKSKEWTPLPSLNKARYYPMCISQEHFIVACGGGIAENAFTQSIEVFNNNHNQWVVATSTLPNEWLMFWSAATLHNTSVFLGGSYRPSSKPQAEPELSKQVFCFHSTSPLDEITWQSIGNVPHVGAIAATLGGCLLALGGVRQVRHHKKPNEKESKMIYLYIPSIDSWIHIGNMPLPLASPVATVATVSGNEMLVISGCKMYKCILLIQDS